MCTLSVADTLYLFTYNATHTATSLTFYYYGVTAYGTATEGCAFKNLFLYVDTCDISCLTCSGPANVIFFENCSY